MSTPQRGRQAPGRATTTRRGQRAADREAAARRARTRRTTIAGTVVAVTIATIFGIVLAVSHGGGGGGRPTSTEPTSFDLPRLNGDGDVALASFHGKPTVVNFFASWCTACQGELPGFARVSRELQGRVNFVGVNSLETGDGMAMARQFGVDWWPIARDVDGQQASGLHDALGGQGMPISAFYDADGKLLHVSLGALSERSLRATLQQYFGVS